MLRDLGRYAEAGEAFRACIELDRNRSDAWTALGNLYGDAGHHGDAVSAFECALGLKVDLIDALLGIARSYAELGRMEDSAESLRQTVRYRPDHADALWRLALTYERMGRWQEAADACKRAVRLRPQSAEAHQKLGKARLFGDAETLAEILAVSDPGVVKKLGRKVRGFDEERWVAARFELVTRGNIEKFGQDARLRGFLLKTGEAVLVVYAYVRPGT